MKKPTIGWWPTWPDMKVRGRPRHPNSKRPPRRICRLCWRERVRAYPHGHCVPSCILKPAKRHRCTRCGADRLARHAVHGPDGRWVCSPTARGTCYDTVTPPGTPERACNRCGDSWPLTAEYWHQHSPGRFRGECRACRSERRAALARGAARNRRGCKVRHDSCTERAA